MARRKKKEEPSPAPAVAPESTAPKNGQMMLSPAAPAQPPIGPAEPPPPPAPPPSLDEIRAAAVEWATRSGLRPPFTVTGPDRVDFPQHGHGYLVLIQERTGKRCRLGTARFTSEGQPSYWSIDGAGMA